MLRVHADTGRLSHKECHDMDNNDGFDYGNARIVEYWNRRRQGLDKKEWEDLYRLMVPVLMRTRLPSDYNEDGKRWELVNDFFQDKVLFNAATSTAGDLQNVHALHIYLKNYALQRLREDVPEPLPPEEVLEQLGGAAADDPGHVRLLGQAGIDALAVIDSADRFFDLLDDAEIALLRSHSCADGARPEPMSAIAARTGIVTTWFNRAKALGITRSKGETYRGYERTKIGRWLVSNGAELHPDWREEVAALLLLLCQRVRLHRREAP